MADPTPCPDSAPGGGAVGTGAGEGLLHPVAVGSLVLLLANDHLFKGWWGHKPGWGLVTGKLSDVAGLVFLPLFLCAVSELVTPKRHRRKGPSVGVAMTVALSAAVFFAWMNTTETGGLAWQHALGALQWPFLAAWSLLKGAGVPPLRLVKHVVDPTDLVALPAVLVAVFQARSRARSWAKSGATNASNSSL